MLRRRNPNSNLSLYSMKIASLQLPSFSIADGLMLCPSYSNSTAHGFGFALPPFRSRESHSHGASLTTITAVVKRSPKRLKYDIPASRKVDRVLLVQVDPSGSDLWKLEEVVKLLKDGGVGIIPTDTVYAIVCSLRSREGIERMYRIKNMNAKKPLSILCRSFHDIDQYTLGFPRGNSQGQTNIFRAARQCLPGPYTFILPASKEMPKQCIKFGGSTTASYAPRRSVGVRMPNDLICQEILKNLDDPLLCTSVTRPADDQWLLDPVLIADIYGTSEGNEGVDFVVDGAVRIAEPSTVVDMTGTRPVLLRSGKGVVEDWMLMEAHDSTETSEVEVFSNPYKRKAIPVNTSDLNIEASPR